MRTVDAVKGRWPVIFKHYGLPSVTGKKHFAGECPVCSRKGKFRIDDKNGTGSWVCVCGAGDGWQLLELTQKKGFRLLAQEIDQLLGIEYNAKPVLKTKNRIEVMHEKIMRRYASLQAIRQTAGELYLMGRGISVLPDEAVRYSISEKTGFGEYQALYSIASDDKGRACYLHRTFLDGVCKAPIPVQKKMISMQDENYLNHAMSVAIRMFPVSSTLGIAEGIETALSCKQFTGCNTWATLNASLMRRFRAPGGVKHLIIFADTDDNGAGHAAAFECAHRNILSNNDVEQVSVRWPERGDFNDMILDGARVYEWVLRRSHETSTEVLK